MKLSLKLKYIMEKDAFEIESEFKPEKNIDIVEECLRAQMGAGSDSREPVKKDVYTIVITLDLDGDVFQVASDTGNDNLTCGLMAYFLEKQ